MHSIWSPLKILSFRNFSNSDGASCTPVQAGCLHRLAFENCSGIRIISKSPWGCAFVMSGHIIDASSPPFDLRKSMSWPSDDWYVWYNTHHFWKTIYNIVCAVYFLAIFDLGCLILNRTWVSQNFSMKLIISKVACFTIFGLVSMISRKNSWRWRIFSRRFVRVKYPQWIFSAKATESIYLYWQHFECLKVSRSNR